MLLKDTPEIRARFWAKVDKNGPIPEHRPELGPCWIWTAGTTHRGYGKFCLRISRDKTQTFQAHRVAYFLEYGSVPDGMQVLHSCDNRPCCRPDHLFSGTYVDNVADMVAKGRQVSGMATHPEQASHGEEHYRARLREGDVLEIRRAYAAKETTQTALAARYEVTQALISAIVLRKLWKHL